MDSQWAEFEKIVSEQLMGSVNAYMSQLPTLKEKVAKRGRKLVDFDGARNSYNAIKASSKKVFLKTSRCLEENCGFLFNGGRICCYLIF